MTWPTSQEIESIAREEIPATLTQLAALQTALAARLLATGNKPAPESPISPPADRLLTVREVVGRLSATKAFVYDLIRRGTLPAMKLSPRNTRIREADLVNYEKMLKALR